jgi:hypothetical protein
MADQHRLQGSDWAYSVSGALIDELPLLTTATIRPYVIATLLHRGAVRYDEIIASVSPHCSTADLKVGGWDPVEEDWCEGTRLEKLIDEVLGEMIYDGTLRYNEESGLWVLTPNNLSAVISWAAALGARIPFHLMSELNKQQVCRLPPSVI